ncbi:MAG: hypothetical protein IT521_06160 [Burkholderiales bacterium]|nr:hypothetical protein [Burkholderiales bacterium]
MTTDECDYYHSLPATIRVWRGCFQHNIDGLSWSMDRKVALAFPFYRPYARANLQAFLVEGLVEKAKIGS